MMPIRCRLMLTAAYAFAAAQPDADAGFLLPRSYDVFNATLCAHSSFRRFSALMPPSPIGGAAQSETRGDDPPRCAARVLLSSISRCGADEYAQMRHPRPAAQRDAALTFDSSVIARKRCKRGVALCAKTTDRAVMRVKSAQISFRSEASVRCPDDDELRCFFSAAVDVTPRDHVFLRALLSVHHCPVDPPKMPARPSSHCRQRRFTPANVHTEILVHQTIPIFAAAIPDGPVIILFTPAGAAVVAEEEARCHRYARDAGL